MTNSLPGAAIHAAPRNAAPDNQPATLVDLQDNAHQETLASPFTAEALPWYRREAWIVASVLAVIPVGLAIITPLQWRVPLMGLGGLFMVIAVMLLVRRERMVQVSESHRHMTARK